jgi:hypothetical protein
MMNFTLLQCRHLAWHKKRASEQYLTTRGNNGQNMYAYVDGTYWIEITMGWKDAEENMNTTWNKWIAYVLLMHVKVYP